MLETTVIQQAETDTSVNSKADRDQWGQIPLSMPERNFSFSNHSLWQKFQIFLFGHLVTLRLLPVQAKACETQVKFQNQGEKR